MLDGIIANHGHSSTSSQASGPSVSYITWYHTRKWKIITFTFLPANELNMLKFRMAFKKIILFLLLTLQAAIVHAKKDTLDYVRRLLAAGATPNTLDSFGYSPLTSLIRQSSIDSYMQIERDLQVAELLFKAGKNQHK